MNESVVTYRQIGVIHSEHPETEATPINLAYTEGCQGQAVIFPEFAKGLFDLEGFSHIHFIPHYHRACAVKFVVKPYLQDVEHGMFAMRAICRSNAIRLSIVELVPREDNTFHLDGVDILDGTPLLDLKPYTARFDHIGTKRNGWQGEVDDKTAHQKWKCGYRKTVADGLEKNHES